MSDPNPSSSTGGPAPPGIGSQDPASAVGGQLTISGTALELVALSMTDKALATAMESVAQDEIDRFVTLLEVVQASDIDISLFTIFDFQGFDPFGVMRRLLAVNKHYREVEKRESETLDMLKFDVLLAVAAHIYMGNLQDKALRRRGAVGRMAVDYLMAKYGIKRGSTGSGMGSEVLTFPRIANSFPIITVRMASRLPSKNFGKTSLETDSLPKWLRVAAFSSLCSDKIAERTRMFVLHAHAAYSVDQTIVVHEGEKRKKKVKKSEDVLTVTEAFNLQWPFVEVSSNSPVPKEAMRKAILNELRLQDQYQVLQPVVTRLRSSIGDTSTVPTEAEFKSDLSNFYSS